MILALAIGIAILLVAVLLYTVGIVIIEHDRAFLGVVGGFLALFVISAVALAWLMPNLSGKSDVRGLVSAWVNNGATVQSSGGEGLPLYGE